MVLFFAIRKCPRERVVFRRAALKLELFLYGRNSQEIGGKGVLSIFERAKTLKLKGSKFQVSGSRGFGSR